MKKSLIWFLCFVMLNFFSHEANAQSAKIDSLLLSLKTAAEDTSKVNTLNSLSRLYADIAKYEPAMLYAQQALEQSGKLFYKKGEAASNNNVGVVYWQQGNNDKALDFFTKALNIYIEIRNKKGIANSYNNVGLVYWNLGNYEMAVNNLLKALEIWEEIGDKGGIGMSYLNIGNIYMNQGLYDKALEHYLKSLKIIRETGNKTFEATNISNIGLIYQFRGDYEKALDNYSSALNIQKEINDKKGIATSYNNIGLIYLEHKNYKKALDNELKSLEINKEIGSQQGTAVAYTNIGTIYTKQGKLEDAFRCISLSIKLCKDIGYRNGLKDAYSSLIDFYDKKKNYKQALEYFQLLADLKDTLFNEQSNKQMAEMNTKYDSEKKDKDLIKKDAEIKRQQAEAEKQIFQRNTFSIGFALVLILAFFIYRGYRQKQNANSELESMNRELEKLSIVASETDNGVLICGPQGEIEWSNDGLTRLLGYTFEEMKQRGNTIEELSSNPDIKRLIHQSILDKKSSTYQLLNETKDGTKRWTQSTLTPILDKTGRVKKLVIIDTDINERKNIEEKLSEQNEELEKSQRTISILSEIGQEITSSLSVEKIIEKVHENLNRLMDADVFCIGIHNKTANSIDFPGFIERGKIYSSSYDLKDETRLPVLCFKYRVEILINDLEKEFIQYIPHIPTPVAGESPESLIYLPLLSKEKVIGVINVESFHKNAYTVYHLNILKNLAAYVSIAIENAQLYENLEENIQERTIELVKKKEEIEKTYNNIQVLSEIGQEITSTLNFEKVLDTVYKKVNSLMDATEFGIGIYNPENESIDFSIYIYESKRMSDDLDTWVSMKDKNRLSVWCVENKKPVFINDMQIEYIKYISNLDSYKGEGKLLLESMICLPLIVEEKLVGLISVQSPNKNTYTQNHFEMLQTLASYVAIALDNARLFDNLIRGKEEIEKTYDNIQVLSEIGQQITAMLNFEDIFSKLHENINRLMDAETFGIRIYHPENNSIEIKYEFDKGERQEPVFFSMDDENNLSVWCIKNKKEIFLNDNSNEYKKYVNEIVVIDGEMTHSLMFCPMILKDKVIGVLTVQSYQKNKYTKQHLDILRTLANYTAIAFDNARLYDNMEGEVKQRTAEIEKQKVSLEDKNLKITDSINYAQRIQQSILPTRKIIRDILPDSFVFFRPKDIVSGDFYWIHPVDEHQILLAAVDCTGHGVPGAFMSIMGYNFLERIVKEQKIYQPALILNELSTLIINSLKQTDEIGSIKEGMDIALCKIDYKNLEIEYAGAHNSMYLIRNNILTETKADRRGIGISLKTTPFVNHKIKIEKGDCLYIFSDGYADQEGGPEKEKFYYQPFRELLTEIHSQSMEYQEHKLDEVILKWKGSRPQIDDMLVMGVKI